MPKQIISYLKSKFLTGKKPSQQDFHDLMDSYIHKDESEEINASLIDERISNHDAALKELTPGQIDTLGDLLHIMRGFDTEDDVKALLDAESGDILWANVYNKPGSVPVNWAVQAIVLDDRITDFPDPYAPGQLWSKSIVRDYGNIPLNKTAVILDMHITKFRVAVIGSSVTESYASFIRSVTIGVGPWVNIQ